MDRKDFGSDERTSCHDPTGNDTLSPAKMLCFSISPEACLITSMSGGFVALGWHTVYSDVGVSACVGVSHARSNACQTCAEHLAHLAHGLLGGDNCQARSGTQADGTGVDEGFSTEPERGVPNMEWVRTKRWVTDTQLR